MSLQRSVSEQSLLDLAAEATKKQLSGNEEAGVCGPVSFLRAGRIVRWNQGAAGGRCAQGAEGEDGGVVGVSRRRTIAG